jgi:hypothetical protein
MRIPGKVDKDSDPRARRSATSNGHARARRAGCPGVLKSGRFRSAPRANADRIAAKIAVTVKRVRRWGVACCLSSIEAAFAAGHRFSAVFSSQPRQSPQVSRSRRAQVLHRTRSRKAQPQPVNPVCRKFRCPGRSRKNRRPGKGPAQPSRCEPRQARCRHRLRRNRSSAFR